MKNLFTFLSILVFTSMFTCVRASVVYTDCTDQTVTATNSVSVNMNNDATAEFTLSDLGGSANVVAYTTFNTSSLNFVTWTQATDWDVFKNIPLGTSINASSGFWAYGDCYFNPDYADASHLIPTGSDQYIGVEFTISGSWHYGWVRVFIAANGEVTVKDYAYESIAATSILAGNTGTVGAQELKLESTMLASPNPVQTTLSVSCPGQDLSEIRIFNAAGQLILESGYLMNNGSPRLLDVSGVPDGLYFLEATTTDHKRLSQTLIKN